MDIIYNNDSVFIHCLLLFTLLQEYSKIRDSTVTEGLMMAESCSSLGEDPVRKFLQRAQYDEHVSINTPKPVSAEHNYFC